MERKPFSSILLAAILIPVGLVLYVAVLTYDHARTWTDLSEGISNGLIHCVLYSIGYVIVFVPLIAVAIFATRSQPKSFWLRSTICLSPLLAVCLFSAFIWFTNPITHRSCFESTMGFGMPISATNIQSERCGGGITDISDTYYFAADANEIQEMLELKPFELTNDEPLTNPNGWPEPETWNGVKTYQYNDGSWYYTIQTDDDYTQAIVSAFCI